MKLTPKKILYGEIPFQVHEEATSGNYFFAERIVNRGVLDFGDLDQNERSGLSLSNNGIDTPLIVKSLHCVSSNNTDDSLSIEIWRGTDYSKVKNRVALQYYHKSEMPKSYPELILFPDNTVFVTPSQDCRVLIYCEPVNVSFYANVTI